jgi:hypothetical protein
MPDRFVSESIEPVGGVFDTAAMATGAPGLPMRFTWRGREYAVTRILKTWRETGPCRHGAAEQYVRKHWYRVATHDGCEMEIYIDRQPRRGQDPKRRWWLAAVSNETHAR